MSKKVLITGVSGGIGAAIAKKFIKNNYQLIVSTSSKDNIDNLKNIYGNNHSYYHVNFDNLDKIDDDLKSISQEHKDLSVLVNNAGITDDGLLLRMKYSQWERVIQTNLSSNFKIIKSFLPNMISNKYGKIIGISSVVATTGNPGQTNYVASKSGMIGFYKSVAHEVAKRNINVNIVSPGYITTSMTDKLSDDQKNGILSKIPMQRFGNPIDVANLVFFLSTEDSSYITGQNFNVNGGMLMF